MPPNEKPEISFIIVNYNGEAFIQQCFNSILSQKISVPYEVIVVDNNSSDNSVELIKTFSSFKILVNKENLGFTKANNQAVKIAQGNYIFLLNNDTVLYENALEVLYQSIRSIDNVGAIAPKLLNEDLSLQVAGSFFGRIQYMTKNPKKVGFLSCCAMLIRKDYFIKIGMFDEAFFFYNDDIDLSKRILKSGKLLIYEPNSKVIHFGGLSTKFRKIESVVAGYKGGLYLCFKHYPLFVFWVYRCLLCLDCIIRISIYYLLNLINKKYNKHFKGFSEILKFCMKEKFIK
ncbi:hypothetical protein DID75_00740 [Candidatus Marinamargulisbacteria bacterium SCGC AG-410-N11]|nr:hypothetical protein DID75_00740 [Candidatus Marinamargulisbacteria bacterium SCGC AG-410-N11]